MHEFGGRVAKYVDRAREEVARFVNCSPEEIIFTSCATESDNAAIRGTADWFGKDLKVITTAVEHPAVLQPVRRLKAQGHETVELPVNGVGQIDLDQLRAELASAKGPKLVSAMWANNETGTLFPIAKIAEICREYGAVLHTDAVQAAGKAKIDVQAVPVDMLSISGHKFHAPKGIGFMYVRKGTKLKPFMLGGHQESGRRAGTENVPYIVGLAKACELARLGMADEERKLTALRDRLEAGILAKCPDVRVNGDKENRLPNTLNVSFEYIEGEAIAYHLSDLGICISTGSACASGSLDPSHVIRAMGVPFTAVHGSVRFSLSRYSTDEEVDYLLEKLPPVIANLRELSPFGPGKDVSTFK
jgi:cysteine desulfurase